MAGLVMTGPALARGARSDMFQTWRRRYEVQRAKLQNIMDLGIKSTNFVELYGYGETPIYPGRTPWGEAPRREPHLYRTFEVENMRWTSEVAWLRRDRTLNNIGKVRQDASAAGDNWGTLAERILFQVIQGTTDSELLAAVPNAPDGVGIWSATDGAGNDRFGVSGGNTIASNLWTTPQGVRDGFYAAMERILAYQDPRGQPAIDEATLESGGMTYVYPISRMHEVKQGFQQLLTAIAASTATSNAAVSNIVLDTGMPVTLWGSPRITSDGAYVFANAMDVKPVFEQIALPLEETFHDKNTSVDHRDKGIESVMWEQWAGYGVNLPIGACRLTT